MNEFVLKLTSQQVKHMDNELTFSVRICHSLVSSSLPRVVGRLSTDIWQNHANGDTSIGFGTDVLYGVLYHIRGVANMFLIFFTAAILNKKLTSFCSTVDIEKYPNHFQRDIVHENYVKYNKMTWKHVKQTAIVKINHKFR